ncbi:UNVERIFIED_ORG: lipopolysaccharide/colanic/teichoic acid biosynthesis glycosyltransferase [Zoogloea ramigera]|uniref:Sugar transferase n=1 Tax=Duganella zoogloeoides TaxID=75659 RepID=A0ABZ0XSH8_9BURK|nr:sugar transferase [Duganella zoogloeoides]WQH02526.1 sugar transferase [Duganella zoogloeoides]
MLAKRLFDIAAALAGLLLLSPLLLLVAAWIRCDSPGPVLFRQRRVGRDGAPFQILKFRTMATGAERDGQLSLADDRRATRAGRWLRRHKLDELPQLVNVLRGDMSLVGPRPEVPRYVAHYPPAVRAVVLSVAPGITDWAALRFRNEGDILRQAADPEHAYLHQVLPVKLKYYVRYVQRRSFATDLQILLCTVATLLFGARRKRPLLRVLRSSRLAHSTRNGGQSVLIDWLRGLAALQVAAAHLRAQVFPGLSTVTDPPLWYQGLAFMTGFAHQAVLVFFVLSGWLVGGVFLDRSHDVPPSRALRDYALDRATRLWTVLLPAFLLMLALAWAGALPWVDASKAADTAVASVAANVGAAWSFSTLLGNLVDLQTLVVPPFGENFPLWSLANETWYYVLFPLLVIAARAGAAWLRLACAALALAVAALLGAAITGYFLVWLLGVAASRLRFDFSAVQRWLWRGALLVVAALLRLGGQDGDFTLSTLGPDLLLALLLVVCLCSVGRSRPAAAMAQTGAFLAGFSFTLYVVHIPLQRMLWAYRDGALLAPGEPASLAVYAAMLAVVLALAYLFHLPFEAQTGSLRRLLRRRLPGLEDIDRVVEAPPARRSIDAG